MKILFVEDELSKNIPRIVRLFEKYLGEKRIQALMALEGDCYGGSPEKIKAIVDDTNMVEAEYRFPEALAKIVNENYKRYALFIVDRNLVESDYTYAEAVAADPSSNEEAYKNYNKKEGDCLLVKLALKRVDVEQMFFFLTVNTAETELANAKELEGILGSLGDFKKWNFIEKSKKEHLDRLKERIDNHEDLSRTLEHQHHIRLLRQHLGETAADRFRRLVLRQDEHDRIEDNLTEIRKIYETILAGACRHIPDMARNCVNTHGVVFLGAHNWLWKEKHINSIIRNHCFSIKTISSDYGTHDPASLVVYPPSHDTATRAVYRPSPDTVKALIYALRDVIKWFGGVCAKP